MKISKTEVLEKIKSIIKHGCIVRIQIIHDGLISEFPLYDYKDVLPLIEKEVILAENPEIHTQILPSSG